MRQAMEKTENYTKKTKNGFTLKTPLYQAKKLT